ncbi:hypothetical protein [Yersinia nurmii]|uniref:hypothetical protein n=1 Tax=Yersinia nurmii TaxID=685706 RepID=UPI0012ED06A4|nr:hypothetical protein [Yersinia nurmii]
MKKKPVGKLFEIRGCSLSGTPYNAPPLTGNNETNFAGSGSVKQAVTPVLKTKVEKKSLTLQRESVLSASRVTVRFAASEQVTNAL